MLHAFFDDRAWFASKRFGWGAGRPITWQGWVVILAYLGAVFGLALTLGQERIHMMLIARGAVFLLLTVAFVAIIARRTRGGFRWRWGGED